MMSSGGRRCLCCGGVLSPRVDVEDDNGDTEGVCNDDLFVTGSGDDVRHYSFSATEGHVVDHSASCML
jgi:hypothetical protein